MRAGLSTIQQTLTPEASAVLTASIAEAARRGHGQTTPLHVAATLLVAPSGLLRQACLRSHPTSSHPLQCRALELCFSVALDRLPTSSTATAGANSAVAEPAISNALMAALKRAQAHQRRGCPESQQQPLLAVKVELEQLIVSILDDPGVSRVMREASFSSPAVKSAIEAAMSSPSPTVAAAAVPSTPVAVPISRSSSLGLGLAAHRQQSKNFYINPKLHHHQPPNASAAAAGAGGGSIGKVDEVKRVVDILLRAKKRNPVLVGDSEPESLMKEVIQKIECGEIAGIDAKVVSLEKLLKSIDRTQIASKIKELEDLIESQIGKGVILDLGDLKWLVDAPAGVAGSVPIQQQQAVAETGRAAVAEMSKITKRFCKEGDGKGGGRVWLIGTATCATYLRCQVYHPTMENDWDLQAVPIAPRSPLPGLFPRMNGTGILSTSVESLAPTKSSPAVGAVSAATLLRRTPEKTDDSRRTLLCSQCMENYERELAKLVAKEFEKSSYNSKPEVRPALPQWLQIATGGGGAKAASNQPQAKEQEINWKQSTDELQKRWRDTCSRLHRSFHAAAIGAGRPLAPATPVSNAYNPILLSRQPLEPKSPLSTITPLQADSRLGTTPNSSHRPLSPPSSPVKTDLVLGRPKPSDLFRPKDTNHCIQNDQKDRIAGHFDKDAFKRLFTGLNEKVSWQPEAASAVINAVLQSKSGNGKVRGPTTKADTWLLFIGPDRVGKVKMASALSELLFGASPVSVSFGRARAESEDGESDVSFRGRRPIDRIVEAIRQNPFSMVVLEDIDRADALVLSAIKRAVELGRIADSYGREVSLGSVIFILTADWLPEDLRCSQNSLLKNEEKILEAACSGWQLKLSVGQRPGKRRAEWLCDDDDDLPSKPRKESCLSLDLNLAVGVEEEAAEGSRNSSDLTVEHEQEHGRLAIKQPASSAPHELIDSVDYTIIFKPVDFAPLRLKVSASITSKFTAVVGSSRSIFIEDDVLDQMVGAVWLGSSTATALEEWAERVLAPHIEHLKGNLKTDGGGAPVRLSSVKGSEHTPRSSMAGGDWLPTTVTVSIDGLGTCS